MCGKILDGNAVWGLPAPKISPDIPPAVGLQPDLRCWRVKSIGSNNQERVWNAIRPALVALDSTFAGDEEAFCEAYAAGDYAPSL